MTLDDLNSLNIKDIANWPILPKALAMLVVFVGILFAGY